MEMDGDGERPRKRGKLGANALSLIKQQIKVENDDEGPTLLVSEKEEQDVGFGYGESTGGTRGGGKEGVRPLNGHPPTKPKLVSRVSGSGDKRSANIVGNLLKHLASARHSLDQSAVVRKRTSLRASLGVARVVVKQELLELARERRRGGATRLAAPVGSKPRQRPRLRAAREVDLEDEVLAGARNEREEEEHEDSDDGGGGACDAECDEDEERSQQMKLLQRRLESHYSLMRSFIRTRSEPTIFYLPRKHTKESKRALQSTREAIDQKVASLEDHLRSVGEPCEEEGSDSEDSDAGVSEER